MKMRLQAYALDEITEKERRIGMPFVMNISDDCEVGDNQILKKEEELEKLYSETLSVSECIKIEEC